MNKSDNCGDRRCCPADHGPVPFAADITRAAQQNMNFRTAYWTGCHLQMTLMCIPIGGEVGLENHPDTDQFIRVEAGQGCVMIGACKDKLNQMQQLNENDAVFVPAGTWHYIRNTGKCPLKLSSIYAPPHHPHGAIHRTKADSDDAES